MRAFAIKPERNGAIADTLGSGHCYLVKWPDEYRRKFEVGTILRAWLFTFCEHYIRRVEKPT